MKQNKNVVCFMNMKKGIDVQGPIMYLMGILVITIVLFTWFFPTLNGSTALNNSTKLELGGTNYSWFVPLVVIVLLFSILVLYMKRR